MARKARSQCAVTIPMVIAELSADVHAKAYLIECNCKPGSPQSHECKIETVSAHMHGGGLGMKLAKSPFHCSLYIARLIERLSLMFLT